jgi:hypothetical protein
MALLSIGLVMIIPAVSGSGKKRFTPTGSESAMMLPFPVVGFASSRKGVRMRCAVTSVKKLVSTSDRRTVGMFCELLPTDNTSPAALL